MTTASYLENGVAYVWLFNATDFSVTSFQPDISVKNQKGLRY